MAIGATPRSDGETSSIEAAVIKSSEGATFSDRNRFDVIPVPIIDGIPPLEHYLSLIDV